MDQPHHTAPPSPSFVILPSAAAAMLPRAPGRRFELDVPPRWRAAVPINPFAAEAEREVIAWFQSLGCSPAEIDRARRFDIAGYVGIPFPTLPKEKATALAKYLSLWLLWDDVEVETLDAGFRVDAARLVAGLRPEATSRFEEGWWQLFSDLAARHSARWMGALCDAMSAWSTAALEEALAMRAHRATGALPSFAGQMEMRIDTIGMWATVLMLEDLHEIELPPSFHALPEVHRLKWLAGQIVGVGNDLLSFGKDHVEGKINLVTTLMRERGIEVDEALEALVRMHDDALAEYDRIAGELEGFSPEVAPIIDRWLSDLRVASVGFSLWESQAPRYTAYKVVHRGRVIEPRFPAWAGEPAAPSSRRLGAPPSSRRFNPSPSSRRGPPSVRRGPESARPDSQRWVGPPSRSRT